MLMGCQMKTGMPSQGMLFLLMETPFLGVWSNRTLSIVHYWSQICGCYTCCKGSPLAAILYQWAFWTEDEFEVHDSSIRQLKCHCTHQGQSVPCSFEIHWYQVPLYLLDCEWWEDHPWVLSYRQYGGRHPHEGFAQPEGKIFHSYSQTKPSLKGSVEVVSMVLVYLYMYSLLFYCLPLLFSLIMIWLLQMPIIWYYLVIAILGSFVLRTMLGYLTELWSSFTSEILFILWGIVIHNVTLIV
jgi:hypothetical protein